MITDKIQSGCYTVEVADLDRMSRLLQSQPSMVQRPTGLLR